MMPKKKFSIRDQIMSRANATMDDLYAKRNALLSDREEQSPREDIVTQLEKTTLSQVAPTITEPGLKSESMPITAPLYNSQNYDETKDTYPSIPNEESNTNTIPIPITIPIPQKTPITNTAPSTNTVPTPPPNNSPKETVMIPIPNMESNTDTEPVPITIPVSQTAPISNTEPIKQKQRGKNDINYDNYCTRALKSLKTHNKSLAALGMLFLLHSLIPSPEGRVKIDRIVAITGMAKHNILSQLQALEDVGIIRTVTRDHNGRVIQFLKYYVIVTDSDLDMHV
jgi:hypothetical protein